MTLMAQEINTVLAYSLACGNLMARLLTCAHSTPGILDYVELELCLPRCK